MREGDVKGQPIDETTELGTSGWKVGAAFVAFSLSHAGCGEPEEFRLGERSLACHCPGCDELRIFGGAVGDA